MDLNTDVMNCAYAYVHMTQVKPESFSGDIMGMLNYTRDITISYANLNKACNNDSVLVSYYRELVTCLDVEDYDKALEYKNLIITYESKI